MNINRLIVSALSVAALIACTGGEFRAADEPDPGTDAPAATDPAGGGGGGENATVGPTGQPTTCSDECPVEQARECDPATAGHFRSCLRGDDGCLKWVSSLCQNGAPSCPEAQGGCIGTCPPAGTEACTIEGATRCQGDKAQTCVVDSGCLRWSEAADCPTAGHKCIGEKCQSTCASNCPSKGANRCLTGTNLQETCNEVQPGCLQWGSQRNCGSGFSCILASGQCVACNDAGCSAGNVGSKRCVSSDVQTCQLAFGACYKWAVTSDCGSGCCTTSNTCANNTTTCGNSCTNCTSYCAARGMQASGCSTSGTCTCRTGPVPI